MAALPYMQLYVADYLADTMHLTTEEHGAYLLLIFNYWQTGKPIPKTRLARIARLSSERWTDVERSLNEFFNDDGTEWVHERVERDLEMVYATQNQRSAAGKASAAARRSKKATKPQQERNDRPTTVETPLNENSTVVEIPLNENSTNKDVDVDVDTDKEKSFTPLPPSLDATSAVETPRSGSAKSPKAITQRRPAPTVTKSTEPICELAQQSARYAEDALSQVRDIQGIPEDGEAARQQLLAKFRIVGGSSHGQAS